MTPRPCIAAALAVALASAATTASAADLCPDYKRIVADSASGFSTLKGPAVEAEADDDTNYFQALQPPAGAERCIISAFKAPSKEGTRLPAYRCKFKVSGDHAGRIDLTFAKALADCLSVRPKHGFLELSGDLFRLQGINQLDSADAYIVNVLSDLEPPFVWVEIDVQSNLK